MSWDVLNLSLDLMRKLLPDAEFHVNWQRQMHGEERPDVQYHQQDPRKYSPPSMGKLDPLRFNVNDHELWLDNDHLMWAFPPCWDDWVKSDKAALIWRLKSSYCGTYTHTCKIAGTSGFFGLPPGYTPPPFDTIVPFDMNRDQEEMGYVSQFLGEFEEQYFVDEGKEFTCYTPPIPHWETCQEFGTCGTHLTGVNRGSWNPYPIMQEIRRRFL